MPPVLCRECGKEIGVRAGRCPHCGAPGPRAFRAMIAAVVAVALIFLALTCSVA